MAISPPSDIVLDVARAVEPAGVEAARAQLANRSGGAAAGRATAAFSLDEMTNSGSGVTRSAAEAKFPDSFKRFEAMVLQTFIQNMLPKDTENVYGKGVAGDMWKSMLAGQLADVMTERGGIGISDSILGDHYIDGKNKVSIGPVSGGPAKAETEQQSMLSTALVQEFQRKMARSLSEDQAGLAAKPNS